MDFKKILEQAGPYALIVVLFIGASYLYFSPVLEGKDLPQMDNMHAKGMAKEVQDYQEKTGEKPQWTNSMFGGMPTYHIGHSKKKSNIFAFINKYLRFSLPYKHVAILFLYLLGFFVLLSSMRMDKWLAFIGALAFGLSSYNIIIIGAGHITKAYAIAFMAPVVAGVILTYRRRYLAGALLTLVGLGAELASHHIQITYYLAILVLILGIGEFVHSLQEKTLPHFFKASAILVAAALLAIAPSIQSLWKNYEYSKYSIRGDKVLSEQKEENGKQAEAGLDRDYALAWSYGVKETFTLLIPDIVGGSTAKLGSNEEAMQSVERRFKQYVASYNQYWGPQPFTEGPVYLGAIIVFLFVLGMFIVRDPIKWPLFIATILAIMLSWGKNFGVFTDFFFYNLPLYNKFRTVSMSLVITSVTMPLIAFMGVRNILKDPSIIKKQKNAFFISLGLTGGVSLLFALMPGLFFNFMSAQEMQQLAQAKAQNPQAAAQYDELMANLEAARRTILTSDAWRSFAFIALAGLATWMFASVKKFHSTAFLALLGILIVTDIWVVDRRYLSNENFKKKSTVRNQFQASRADQVIMKDQEHPNFRVLNITRDPFREVQTSYFHQSIGGYHGAKMRRYQDLIDYHLSPSVNRLRSLVQKEQKPAAINNALAGMNVLNMLNTRYVIYNPQQFPIINNAALGNVWLADNIRFVDSPDESITALHEINIADEAIMENTMKDKLGGFTPTPDSVENSSAKLISYEPEKLVYQVNAKEKELAVFSEIYYPKGWQAFIDDEPVPHFRVNYILRALVVPKGPHKVTFTFEPKVSTVGYTLSVAASVVVALVILGLLAFMYWQARRRNKAPEDGQTA